MGRKKLFSKEKIVDALNRWFLERGIPPTVEEFRKYLKVGSTRTALRYLEWLEEEGDIERWSGARGIRPLKGTNKGLETRPTPLVGTAPAGPFMTAEENREGIIRLPKDFFNPPTAKFFLLRVKGDSMNQCKIQGDMIEDGDLVLVRQQATAKQGDVVVALLDGEATIKRLSRGQGYYVLNPESSNDKHPPIVVKENFRVQGIVIRILKKGSGLLNPSN